MSSSLLEILEDEGEGSSVGSKHVGIGEGDSETRDEGCGDTDGCMVQFEACTSAQHLEWTSNITNNSLMLGYSNPY